LSEFSNAIAQFQTLSDPAKMEEFVFSLYDHDGDGFISASELFQMLNGIIGATFRNENQLEAIVNGVMKEFDRDGDGRLNSIEFKSLIQGQGLSSRLGISLEG
jgi:Ca2+-binding EF-hand superfamily protein